MNKLLKYLNFSYPQTSTENLLNHISKIIENNNYNNSKNTECSNKSSKLDTELENINSNEISRILKFLRIFEFQEEINFIKETENINEVNATESFESIEKEINEKIDIMIKKFEEFKNIMRNALQNNQNINTIKAQLYEINSNLSKNIEILTSQTSKAQIQSKPNELIKFKLSSQSSEDDNLFENRKNSAYLLENINLNSLQFIKNNIFTDLRYICDFEANGHIVITDGYPGQCLIIYDRSDLSFIKTVNLNGQMGRLTGVCALNEKKQLVVVDWSHTCLYLLNSEYKLIQTKTLTSVLKNNRKRWYEAIAYNNKVEKFYLIARESCSVLIFDKDLNELNEIQLFSGQASFESIRYYDGKIYVSDSENHLIYVLDSELEEKICFGGSVLECPTDVLIDNSNEKHIFVLEYGKKDAKVFDVSNFKFIKSINIETCFSNNGLIVNNKLIINSDSKELHLYEINTT